MLDKIMEIFEDIFENNVVKMLTALTVVGVMSGVVLALVFSVTDARIKANRNKESERAILELFPSADLALARKGEAVKGAKGIIEVVDKSKKVLGYAFIAKGNGYQGEIKMIAGIGKELKKLIGIVVVESQETPGLGAEIVGHKFRDQFKGLSVYPHPIEYVRNEKPSRPYEIEAITGATISSRAVVNILNKRIKEVEEELKGK